MYKKSKFGVTPAGETVYQYTLTNKCGVSASFLNLGGIWTSMITPDRDGRMDDVVLGYDTVEAYMNNGAHLGEIVGRNANRIGGAKFTLNGQTYCLTANNGSNNLHSGDDFYRSRIWDADISETEEGTAITFSLESPHMDQGYPGNAVIKVTYTLTEDHAVKIDYHLTADQDTIANLTNHSYFNLAGHQSGSAMDQLVFLDADYYTPMDQGSVPTGQIAPVKGTPMDFTQRKPIGLQIDEDFEQLKFGSGYDHNWVLNHKDGEVSLAARAWDEKSGRTLEVYTDLPGVQFYTANYLGPEFPGKGKTEYKPRQGYCFETQFFPNAVNTEAFKSPILKKGDEYKSTTIYRFAR